MGPPVSVVVADPQPARLRGLVAGLSGTPGIEVVATAALGTAAIAAVVDHRPDVAVFDLWLEDRDAIAACSSIREIRPATGTLVFADSTRPEHVLGAVTAGAAAYLLRSDGLGRLVAAVKSVARGHHVLSEAVTGTVCSAYIRLAVPAQRGDDNLTARENQVLALVAEGAGNQEIARRLGISPHTVKNHMRRILDKLDASSRTEAAVYAARQRR